MAASCRLTLSMKRCLMSFLSCFSYEALMQLDYFSLTSNIMMLKAAESPPDPPRLAAANHCSAFYCNLCLHTTTTSCSLSNIRGSPFINPSGLLTTSSNLSNLYVSKLLQPGFTSTHSPLSLSSVQHLHS